MSTNRQVMVTGMGLVTPLGLDEATVWKNLMDGVSGIRRIRSFDVTPYRTPNGAEVDREQLAAALAAADIRCGDRAVDMAVLAALRALEQAGIVRGDTPREARPIATLVGTGIGSTQSYLNTFTAFFQKGVSGMRPTSIPRSMANAASAQISMRFRLTGPNYAIISACASSTIALGIGFRMIREGHTDQALCVGTETSFDPFLFGAWNNLRVMSSNPDPDRACRPFDRDRDGLILGEGAGALLLEAADTARARGARVRAEICGYGESSDAQHITRPSADGQVLAIRAAVKSAGVAPEEIGFINAHGTATETSDETECSSITLALGPAASRIPVASSKSFFGHLLGASGTVETAVTILGLEEGRVPGNRNLENPDPACSVPLVGRQATDLPAAVAMKNSFGFGGNNAVLIVRKAGIG